MNKIDQLTEQIFNDIFERQQLHEDLGVIARTAMKNLFSSGSKEEKEKTKFISVLEQYITKIYKVAKDMVSFAQDPKNNTQERRPVAQAVGQKAQILETLCTTMYNSPFGEQITKHVDFSKISVETKEDKLKRVQRDAHGRPEIVTQPQTTGRNEYFSHDAQGKITQNTDKNKSWNTAKFGWTQMRNRNTGKTDVFRGWSINELMTYAASGQQAFRTQRNALDDKQNRPVLPDENGNVDMSTPKQEELYRKLLDKWVRIVDKLKTEFIYDLRALHYNLTSYPDIQQLVTEFKSQCTIFVSTRKIAPQTHSSSVKLATKTPQETNKNNPPKPLRRRDKLRVINFDDGTKTSNICYSIFGSATPPDKVKEAWVKTLQALNITVDGFNRFLDANNWSGIRQRLEHLWRNGDNTHLTARDKDELYKILKHYGIELDPPT